MTTTTLPQTTRNQETADKVNALLTQASALGVETTRRQARKALQGRGSLRAKLKAAEPSNDSCDGSEDLRDILSRKS